MIYYTRNTIILKNMNKRKVKKYNLLRMYLFQFTGTIMIINLYSISQFNINTKYITRTKIHFIQISIINSYDINFI